MTTKERLDRATFARDSAVENLRRIGEYAGPILEREGYPFGSFIPDSLATRLMLAGNAEDARWVTRYLQAVAAVSRAHLSFHRTTAAFMKDQPGPTPRSNDTRPSKQTATRASAFTPKNDAEPGVRWTSRWVGLQAMPPVEPWHRTTPPWKDRPVAG